MAKNGTRPRGGAGYSVVVGKLSKATEFSCKADVRQAANSPADLHQTRARLDRTPDSGQAGVGRAPIDWLWGISCDSRIGVLHRFALIGIGLHHRRDQPDAIASAIGLDRGTILAAIDAGRRRGWLLADSKHSGLRFTFPPRNLLSRPCLPAAPSTLPRRAS